MIYVISIIIGLGLFLGLRKTKGEENPNPYDVGYNTLKGIGIVVFVILGLLIVGLICLYKIPYLTETF